MLIIDVSMLVRRCYAKMDFLTNSKKIPTGMEFGTLRTLESLKKKYPDQKIVLCFDSPKNFKREQDPKYKANRRSPSSAFYGRLEAFKNFLRCLYPSTEVSGYEADDLMFSLAKMNLGPHLLYTNDHDLLQAVSIDAQMLKSFHSKLFVWDVDKIYKEYGVYPIRLPEYFAFTGDKVDNITGVPRIPKRPLAALIEWAEDLSTNQTLVEIKTADWSPKMKVAISEFINSGQWRRNYELIKLRIIPQCELKPVTNDDAFVVKKLKEWEIYSLALSKEHAMTCNEEF